MNYNEIGKRIRQHREIKKINQKTLAELIGVTGTYIGMIERGERIPKLETFISIVNVLGASANELLADVLSTSYEIKYSALIDRINELDQSDKDRIYDVIEVLIKHSAK